ncbi:MAG: GGDEF domain-containing protein [Butyrivibrio sp.]|nr:GGDEF domain-containing protein [Butyrivibrio sp.]
MFWSQFVVIYLEENNEFGYLLITAGHTAATLIVISSIVNIFVPMLFTVDSDGVSNVQGLRYVVLGIQIIILIVISIYAFLALIRKKIRSSKVQRYRMVALFGLIMAFFLIVQFAFPYLPLYSVAYMLGTCLIRAYVISDEKEEYRRLLDESEKVKDLRNTIASLIDHMPALCFSKEADTGIYLACNQAFAEYANKKGPEDVIGLSDSLIFNESTANRFVQDDTMTLAMDRPYIFYEDVPDPLGNRRQFQTTRLKYFDESGKLCILGMFQDVTDMIRIQRESATNKEAYEQAMSIGIIYSHIAQTLARGYESLYYIDTVTEEFTEYYVDKESAQLFEKKQGEDFFEECSNDIELCVYPEDWELVRKALDRDNMLTALDENKTMTLTYRLVKEGEYNYVTLTASRMEDDASFIIIGVANVDEEVRTRRNAERIKDELIAYNRISALAGDFIVMYLVDTDTDHYDEYNSAFRYKLFGFPQSGDDFFAFFKEQGKKLIYPEDYDKVDVSFNKETVMSEIGEHGIYALNFRMVMEGKPLYVQMKAAIVYEDKGAVLVIGINDVDLAMKREEDYKRKLAYAQKQANADALTGVKNLHAYQEEEAGLNVLIGEDSDLKFAIVVFDVNDLKKVNDLKGHKAGDILLCNAVKIVCDTFKRSPVFRVGGDEFVVIARGQDYNNLDELMGRMEAHNQKASREGGIVIACGMSRYDNDTAVSSVFVRADSAMYENKAALKELKKKYCC